MTSAVLKWLANGVIGLVVAGTLWMAQAVQSPSQATLSMMVAQSAPLPDGAASAVATAR